MKQLVYLKDHRVTDLFEDLQLILHPSHQGHVVLNFVLLYYLNRAHQVRRRVQGQAHLAELSLAKDATELVPDADVIDPLKALEVLEIEKLDVLLLGDGGNAAQVRHLLQ